MKYWVYYTIYGTSDSAEAKSESEFRHSVLGPNHWSAVSYNGNSRSITLELEEELAMIFRMKYGAKLVPVDSTAC